MRDWLTIRRAATPDALALVEAETGDEWTYASLDEEVETLAGQLQALGVSDGDTVGVLMETRPAFVQILWAVQRLGATLVPFNVRLTATEIESQRSAIEPKLLVTERDHERLAREAAGSTPVVSVDESEAEGTTSLESVAAEAVATVEEPLAATRAVLFTSGTTGDPKPVRVTGENFLASAVATAFRLGVVPDDRWLLCLPMYHMGGLSIPIRTTIYGTTTVLQRGFDPEGVRRTVEEEQITGISLVPTMLKRILDAGGMADSLRFALVGGGPTAVELAERALNAGVPIHPTYGMTETASQITTATPADVEAAPGTVGRPLVGTELAILGSDGEPLETGEQGEIAVSGWNVFRGYYGEPDRPDDSWFRTGDVGYRDQAGRLFVTGRASELIVTGGENVVPDEVRREIRAHPAVEDAVVVGLPDEEWGTRVAALVTTTESLDAPSLLAFLEDRLGGFKLPRRVRFVDELPRTASGTVDRSAARAILRDTDA